MDVTLRAARPEDAEAVAAIWYDGWQDGHLGHVPDALVAVRDRASFLGRTVDRLGAMTVADVGGAVAGFVVVVGDEVEQVYVDRAHRGSGVAAPLLAEAERQVAAAGHARAWLAVASGNAPARRFYERQGWRDEGAFSYPAEAGDRSVPVPCQRYVKDVAETR